MLNHKISLIHLKKYLRCIDFLSCLLGFIEVRHHTWKGFSFLIRTDEARIQQKEDWRIQV